MAKPPKPQSPEEVALQPAAAPAFAAGEASSILRSPNALLFGHTALGERILEGEIRRALGSESLQTTTSTSIRPCATASSRFLSTIPVGTIGWSGHSMPIRTKKP
eukprot:1462197-Pleurochrysis_carterae.AAC.1